MAVSVTVNPTLALKTANNVLRQLPYAINNALSRTATESVTAGRKEVESKFQMRKDFIAARVKVLQYPRPNSLYAIVGIDARTKGGPLLLGFFEEGEGGTKLPLHGESIAVPFRAGPARDFDFANPVSPPYLYKNLRLKHGKGRHRTFIVPGVGVFERIGPKKRDIELVYVFEPSAQLKPQMRLRHVLIDWFRKRFNEIFSEEFKKEITDRTAHLARK